MKGLGNPSLYKEITLLVRFGWIIDQRYNPEFVSMSIGSICASIYKMHMSSVSGWNCKSGGTTELMKMIGMSVGAKHHIVKMTSFCLYSIAGHGGKAMVVAAFAFCDKSGTSDNFMNMLSGAGIIIGCIWIEVTHMELPQTIDVITVYVQAEVSVTAESYLVSRILSITSPTVMISSYSISSIWMWKQSSTSERKCNIKNESIPRSSFKRESAVNGSVVYCSKIVFNISIMISYHPFLV